MSDIFHRSKDVTRLTGLSRSTIYEWVAKGKFPQPIKLSERVVVWSERDLSDWQDEQKRKNGYMG